jgi:predicted transcriptional regulator
MCYFRSVIISIKNHFRYLNPDAMEFAKRDIKVIRTLVKKGLLNDFAKGLSKADEILNEWKQAQTDNTEAYHKLHKQVVDFDKHILRRYDSAKESDILYTFIQQLNEGLVDVADLKELTREGQEEIQKMIRFRKG